MFNLATAAYQVEGAWNADGKALSITIFPSTYLNKSITSSKTFDGLASFSIMLRRVNFWNMFSI